MIVLKFGGTSLESTEAIERMESIVRSRLPRQPVVVVSALGKSTDNLLALGTETVAGRRQQSRKKFDWLKDYHFRVAARLVRQQDQQQLDEFLEGHFCELHGLVDALFESGEFTPKAKDALSSFGERLSSGIVAMALRKSGISTRHFDSRMLIRTDKQHVQATPLLKETYANVRNAVGSVGGGVVPVLGGFIASSSDGVTTTLGRNSSNLTAVLVAAALDAKEVEIWTDVDGIFLHDPREVCDQYPIEELSFDDALELAHRGARVLHAGAVLLAREEGITISIRNSRRRELPGTRIVAEVNLVRMSKADAQGAASLD
jgi:aspartate kinase